MVNIFGKQGEDEEYFEFVAEGQEEKLESKVMIHVERMGNLADSDRIQKKVREGNVLLVKIKDLRDKDVSELKRAIEKIRKTCMAINGDIAGLGDEWLIVTPSTAKIHRETVAE